MGDFYGTGIEIWAGFGPVGITEKKNIWAHYERLLRQVFSSFRGQKNQKHCSVCIEKLHEMKLYIVFSVKDLLSFFIG